MHTLGEVRRARRTRCCTLGLARQGKVGLVGQGDGQLTDSAASHLSLNDRACIWRLLETLHSNISRGLMKILYRGRSQEFTWKRRANQNSRFITGRQFAWMVFDHLKISDTDGAILDISDLPKVEHRNDIGQSFDPRWDETVIAMRNKPGDEVLENLYFRQLDQALSAQPVASFVHTGQCSEMESKGIPNSKKRMVR